MSITMEGGSGGGAVPKFTQTKKTGMSMHINTGTVLVSVVI